MSNSGGLPLIDLIIDQAEVALARQNQDGSMPPGCNGPYHNPETPVRNSAHWLITFSWLYRMHSDQRYLDAADRLATYLADPARRPHGSSFHCRNGAMDHCNGLIGQAWAMEGLAEAARLFYDAQFSRIALDVFNKHEFDRRRGLWLRLEPDGRVIGADPTFNHQLWFAATAAELLATANETDHPSLIRFMEKLKDNFAVLGNGRIRHLIYHACSRNNFKRFARRPVGLVCKTFGIKPVVERIDRREQHELIREVGYQCFNLYAFARLARIFDQHPLFTSKRFHEAVYYLESEEYRHAIKNNPYSYGYNAPGFEVPLCLSAFSSRDRGEVLRDARYWIGSQFSLTYNPRTRMFDRNTEDPETLSARIYECSRFPEDLLLLNVDHVSEPK
ncbi:MAG: hypothetical protein MN733_13195 [Nitrososphaera sp.]|nr:hypothetical protein [Nitrososphaera sp.]